MPDSKEDQLKRLRKRIDHADQYILRAFAARFKAVLAVGKLKELMKIPVVQKTRWSVVMKSRLKEAKRLGLSGPFVEEVYRQVHKEAIRIQKKSRRRGR